MAVQDQELWEIVENDWPHQLKLNENKSELWTEVNLDICLAIASGSIISPKNWKIDDFQLFPIIFLAFPPIGYTSGFRQNDEKFGVHSPTNVGIWIGSVPLQIAAQSDI